MPFKKFDYADGCAIDLLDEKKLCVRMPGETFLFDEENKPAFDNKKGESVIEYTGLASDKNETRSWAKAIYQAGGFSELHYHNEHTENYYIISGKAQVILSDVTHELSEGDCITISAGLQHQVHNISPNNGSLVLIVKCTPAWTINDMHFVDAPFCKPR